MPLTDVKAKNANPKGKLYRLYDTAGLYLEVSPAGGKWWRLKYRFGGKEKRLALGVYPEVRLKEARDRRDTARALLRDGIDPSAQKQVVKAARVFGAANSFEDVAREWYNQQSTSAWTSGHARTVIRRLEREVFPSLRGRPLADITAPELLGILRRITDRGALETGHRILVILGQVFRYGIATNRADRDPTYGLRGVLPAARPTHLAAITNPAEVGDLLVKIHEYGGSAVVRSAFRLAPLVFVRPGELRQALWKDIDLDKAEWRFTVSKTHTEHLVPLAKQAVKILRALKPLTGRGKWVFPSERGDGRPMSDATILAALRSCGVPKDKMCGHGFRAMARTILDEVLHERVDLIEHQLAHKVRGPLGAAYNRAQFLDERRRMMQTWADYLDRMKKKAAKRKSDGDGKQEKIETRREATSENGPGTRSVSVLRRGRRR